MSCFRSILWIPAIILPISGVPMFGQFVETGHPPGFLHQWGSFGDADGLLKYPRGVAADASGNVYVADTANSRIQKFDSSGNFLTKWGSLGWEDGEFNTVFRVAADASGNIYVGDVNNNRIQKFDSAGNFLTKWGSFGTADGQFQNPWGVAADAQGNVYVADTSNNRIQKFDSAGNFLTKWGSEGSGDGQFDHPVAVSSDVFGNVYVVDLNNHRIQKFDAFGVLLATWGSSGTGNGQFNYPYDVAVDASGSVYVTDTGNFRIQKFDSAGNFLTKWGSQGSGEGQFNTEFTVGADALGNVYVGDTLNHRIQKFAPLREFRVEGDDARILVRNTSPTGPPPAPLLPGTQFAAIDEATGGYFSVVDGKDVPYFPLFWFSGVGVNGNGGGFVSELPVANDVYSGNEKAAVVLEGRRSDATNLVNTNLLAVRNKWTPALWLTASGNLYTTGSITPGSSRELKEQIERLELEEAVEVLAGLDPVTFRYKEDLEKDLKVGFIAEDVPELVATPDRKGVSAMDIVAVLTRIVQEQQDEISRLKDRLKQTEELRAQLAELEALRTWIEEIRNRLEER